MALNEASKPGLRCRRLWIKTPIATFQAIRASVMTRATPAVPSQSIISMQAMKHSDSGNKVAPLLFFRRQTLFDLLEQFKLVLSFFCFVQFLICLTEGVMRLGIVRVKVNGLLKVWNRSFGLSLGSKSFAEEIVISG